MIRTKVQSHLAEILPRLRPWELRNLLLKNKLLQFHLVKLSTTFDTGNIFLKTKNINLHLLWPGLRVLVVDCHTLLTLIFILWYLSVFVFHDKYESRSAKNIAGNLLRFRDLRISSGIGCSWFPIKKKIFWEKTLRYYNGEHFLRTQKNISKVNKSFLARRWQFSGK